MKLIKRILKIIVILIILAIIFCGIYVYKVNKEVQKDVNNGLIAEKVRELRSKENYTKFDDINAKYLGAVIAVEDHRFYSHKAIDFQSVLRAISNNFKQKKLVEGGSTITQQLVKNLFLDQKQTVNRKVREALLAMELEKRYSKTEILEMYVNNSYFGSGYYTIKDAAKGYYDKSPKELDLNQSALLAGLPNAPSVYDPRKNYDLAEKRRGVVLSKMVEHGYLEEDEANKIKEMPLGVIGAEDKDKNKEKDKEKKDKKGDKKDTKDKDENKDNKKDKKDKKDKE